MGANFQFEKIAKTDEADITADFAKLQDQDRYENGHFYSGGFGMAQGLTFKRDVEFTSEDDAAEWLGYHTEKWGEALAIKLNDEDGEHIGWAIGACCAS